MSTQQYVAIVIIGIFIIPVIIFSILEISKRASYRAHMRHFIDLINVDSGNGEADRLCLETLRISKRHGVPLKNIGYTQARLKKETADSLRRYAARARLFGQKQTRPTIRAVQAELVRTLREKMKTFRTKGV